MLISTCQQCENDATDLGQGVVFAREPENLAVAVLGGLASGHNSRCIAVALVSMIMCVRDDWSTHLAPSLYPPLPPGHARVYFVVASRETGLNPAATSQQA